MEKFDFSLISKYRSLLMGVGTLNVMTLHVLSWGDYHSLIAKLLGWLSIMVFTQGFIILSGFGLFFSFKKSNARMGGRFLMHFYIKRLKRVLIPFSLMSMPFYIYLNSAALLFVNSASV